MDPDPDLIVVVLGNSGGGKSASGNTILGKKDAFESKRSFAPVTTKTSHATANVFEKQIKVYDTPGILGSEKQIKSLCEEIMQSSKPCLFLLTVKIDRFTTEQKNAAEAVLKILGEEGLNKSFLLFTSGDTLAEMTLDQFLNEDPDSELLKIVEKFSHRHHVFNNKNGGAEQVKELLQKSGHLSDGAVRQENNKSQRIVLLGIPGDGKSASGNTILGSEQFESEASFNIVTKEASSKSGRVEGRDVTVVDTPGFTGKLSAKKLYYEIQKSIEMADPGAHAFIIVVQAGRVSQAHIILFEILYKIFGKDVSNFLMVLFTHVDKLKEKERLGHLIKGNKHVSDLVSRCSGRYCTLDNTAKLDRAQVRNLLVQIDELIEKNKKAGERESTGQETHLYTKDRFYEVQKWYVQRSVDFDEFIKWLQEKLKSMDDHYHYSRFFGMS